MKRAATFYKIIRYSYGSGCTSFSCQPFDIGKTFYIIGEANRRLKDTVIENKDFEALIRQYDRENAAGYLDGENAIIDTLFAKEELRTYLTEKEKKEVETREGVYDRLAEGNFEKQEVLEDVSKAVKSIRIHQLKENSNILVRFISLSERKKRGFSLPSETEYEVVYE